jgi:hypothetical protein
MSFDVEQYLHYQIANTPILSHPFPHFYVRAVFPEQWYRELSARLPDQRFYKRLDETGTVPKGAYPERFICELTDARTAEQERDGKPGPWHEISHVFEGPSFAQLVLTRFNDAITTRFGSHMELEIETDCRLVRDFSNYAITPHTDAPRKLVSLLFYMPPDESMKELGTSIFVPNDPAFRCDGTRHHDFKDFKKVMTAPYLPNSLLGFVKNDKAFHGVERIDRPRTQRDSVLYNIYANKLAYHDKKPNPPAAA